MKLYNQITVYHINPYDIDTSPDNKLTFVHRDSEQNEIISVIEPQKKPFKIWFKALFHVSIILIIGLYTIWKNRKK